MTKRMSTSAAWALLIISGVFEAVWATALGASDGFSRPTPTAIFIVAVLISMAGLALAMRRIPTATAYAVWSGIGAALAVTWGMAVGSEPTTPIRIVLLTVLVGAVAGLHAVSEEKDDVPSRP